MIEDEHNLYIGRWQPLHRGHKAIIDMALQRGERVCIAIRYTKVTPSDPLSVKHRRAMLRKVFPDKDRVRIIVIPNIASVNFGRRVGYAINEIQMPANVEGVSATIIRQQIAEGNPTWQTKVPIEVAEYIVEHGLLKDGNK